MRRLLKLTSFILVLLLSNLYLPAPANADSLQATFLEIPYSPQQDDFYYGGYAPFSVEIDGQDVLKYKNCSELTNGIQDLYVVWNINGRTFQQSLFTDSGFIHTIGLTKNGIKCAFLNSHSQSYLLGSNGIYEFRPTEEKVSVSLTMRRGESIIGTGKGYLLNPEYAPETPKIVGLARGDTVSGYAKFLLTGSTFSTPPKISLCDLEDKNDCSLGWGKQLLDHSYVILTNQTMQGKSADLILTWPYLNASGVYQDVQTDVIVQIGSSMTPVPWVVVRQFRDVLEVEPNIDCPSTATYGKNLACNLTPRVITKNGDEDKSVVNTIIEFNISSQLGTSSWKPSSKISVPTDVKSGLNIKAPNAPWDRWIFNLDNGYLGQPQDSGTETYGQLKAGPTIGLKFPNFVMWNTPFNIVANSFSGNISSCTFSMSQKILGTVKGNGRVAKISVVAVWSGDEGSSTNLYYSASCKVAGKTIYGSGVVKGFR